jgi:pyrroline-5-carboxylate reductase
MSNDWGTPIYGHGTHVALSDGGTGIADGRIGIIGVGHLAGYPVRGLRRADPEIEIVLSPRNVVMSAKLAARYGAIVAADNQAVADSADLVILATRPEEACPACQAIDFRPKQTVVSVAAGLRLEALLPVAMPATVVRALPISCVALNESPTLLYPDEPQAHALFALLGQVHVLPDERCFTSASVLSAFYGWVYAWLDETIAWTAQAGVPSQTARSLVLETVRGATSMALERPDEELASMLGTLATPGGITAHGLEILRRQQGLVAWTEALQAVLDRLDNDE